MTIKKRKWTPRFPHIRLGDAVEKVAQPIAGAIDKATGTQLKECGGCKKRKEWLNGLTKPKT